MRLDFEQEKKTLNLRKTMVLSIGHSFFIAPSHELIRKIYRVFFVFVQKQEVFRECLHHSPSMIHGLFRLCFYGQFSSTLIT